MLDEFRFSRFHRKHKFFDTARCCIITDKHGTKNRISLIIEDRSCLHRLRRYTYNIETSLLIIFHSHKLQPAFLTFCNRLGKESGRIVRIHVQHALGERFSAFECCLFVRIWSSIDEPVIAWRFSEIPLQDILFRGSFHYSVICSHLKHQFFCRYRRNIWRDDSLLGQHSHMILSVLLLDACRIFRITDLLSGNICQCLRKSEEICKSFRAFIYRHGQLYGITLKQTGRRIKPRSYSHPISKFLVMTGLRAGKSLYLSPLCCKKICYDRHRILRKASRRHKSLSFLAECQRINRKLHSIVERWQRQFHLCLYFQR